MRVSYNGTGSDYHLIKDDKFEYFLNILDKKHPENLDLAVDYLIDNKSQVVKCDNCGRYWFREGKIFHSYILEGDR